MSCNSVYFYSSQYILKESKLHGYLYIQNDPEGIKRSSCNEPLIDAVAHDHHLYKEVWIPVRFSYSINKRPGIMLWWLHANAIQLAICYVPRYIFYSRQYILKESKFHNLDFCLPIIHTLLHLFNI